MQKGDKPGEAEKGADTKAVLGVFDSTVFLVGNMIGAGIFISPELIARKAGSRAATLLVWLLGGGLSALGAFCYIELGTRFPRNGGEGLYFEKAFHWRAGQLYYWLCVFVKNPLGCSFVAKKAVGCLFPAWPAGGTEVKALSSLLLVLLLLANLTGMRASLLVLRTSIVFKAVSVSGVILGGLAIFFSGGCEAWPPVESSTQSALGSVSLYSFLLMAAMWSHVGWASLNVIGGRVKKPRKTIPVAVGVSLGLVVVLYSALNAIYLFAVPSTLLLKRGSSRPISGVVVAKGLSECLGGWPLSVCVFGAILGSINGALVGSSCMVHAVAQRGYLPARLGGENSCGVPGAALAFQAALSLLFVWTENLLFDQTAFGLLALSLLFFYGLAVCSLFVFRRGGIETGFRVWTPAAVLFVLCSGSIFSAGVGSFLLYGTGKENPFSWQ